MESRTDYRRRRISTRALTTRVAALAGAAALVLGAGISWQMAQGADPALGPKAQAQAQAADPSKRVVRTVIVRRVPAPALTAGAGSSTVPSSGSVTTAPAPVTTSAS